MRAGVLYTFLLPFFYLQSQINTQDALKLSYQDSETNSTVKQASY